METDGTTVVTISGSNFGPIDPNNFIFAVYSNPTAKAAADLVTSGFRPLAAGTFKVLELPVFLDSNQRLRDLTRCSQGALQRDGDGR